MPDSKLLWLIFLTISFLAKSIYELAKKRNDKKQETKETGNNPGQGERIAILEKGQQELEKDFETFKRENREDHQKLFDKLNKTK